jgi:pseudaminic acid synthase
MEFKLGNIPVGVFHKPFIIAEMSGNHNQSLERALKIVDAAADAGAQAIKLQTYTADTMTMKGAYQINDQNSLWNGRELYELYQQAYTPWEWHEKIFAHAAEKGLLAFSSPFDETAVDFLESLNVPFYKVASFENTDWPLLKKIAATGKPVIMSTGVSRLTDIDESVTLLQEQGCKELVLLKCTSTYPASAQNTNLATIPHLQKMFNCIVGLSDHTMGIGAALAAVALGARVIEKHFTLSRAEGGVDSAFSLEPAELKSLVSESERAFLAIGDVQYGVQSSEKNSTLFKRSIYIAKDILAGDIITKEHLKIIRPALGLSPKHLDLVIGRHARKDISAGTPLSFDLI